MSQSSKQIGGTNIGYNQLILEKCKLFPDKVLFYIFYNMPFDKA